MATLNFIIGGLGLLCGACAVFDPIMAVGAQGGGNDPGTQMVAFLAKNAPGWVAVQFVRSIGTLILSLVLLLLGFGLLQLKPWARMGSIFYSALACLLHISWAIYQAVYTIPAMEKFMKGGAMPGGAGAANIAQTAGYGALVLVLAIFCGHAIALLAVMFMPSVVVAFGGRDKERERDEEYDDEFPDDRDDYDDRGHDDNPDDFDDRGDRRESFRPKPY